MAATKKPKAIRGPQYEKILNERYNLSMKECCIMGFRFKTMAESYAFHYLLMNKQVEYLVYDGATERAKVIVREDNPNIKALAENYNGEYYKPSILNDYE